MNDVIPLLLLKRKLHDAQEIIRGDAIRAVARQTC